MSKKEIRSFQSEVKQLLHLMIHSLYSNKEIFFRELISNASDAAEKLRFHAISKPDLYENDTKLRIQISVNKEEHTIVFDDNGIGMNKNDIIENFGTIAKSGTKSFLASCSTSDVKKNNQLIGQFGVGFYSSFIVSEKVSVYTRAAGVPKNEGVFWESKGEGEYTVENIIKNSRGTKIVLHLRKSEQEFLDEWKIRSIIRKYSDHISLPVEFQSYDEKEKIFHWEQINKAQALWTRKKSEIKKEEYEEFYKHISHDVNNPMTWSHNHVEGKQDYITLLYIPTYAPFDLWNHKRKNCLKLHIKRVFIMDDASYFIPNYLRFVTGILDSNDLPLNISRETLQDNYLVKILRLALTKRILQMLENIAKNNLEQYQKFWKEFGIVLKEGLAEDRNNKDIISKLLRFASTNSQSSEQKVSLDDYVNRMTETQEKIYYITSDNYISAKNSPYLEIFENQKIEVLLLFDRIDEWMMNYLIDFNGKKFQSISKVEAKDLNLLQNEKENKEEEQEYFIKKIKKILGKRIKDVRITYRLINTPAVVTTENNEMTTQMAKLLLSAGQSIPEIKYLFEINPKHELIKKIFAVKKDDEFSEWIEILFDQALLLEKGNLENPNLFVKRINYFLNKKCFN